MEALQFLKDLIKQGKKICIFSCEDPYNTPFHRDLLKLTQELETDYLHLVTKAGGVADLASVDLGLQAKGINAFGVFGHYGNVHGHEVCAAIRALGNGYDNYGPDLKKHIDFLKTRFEYNTKKTLEDNIIEWVKNQYGLMIKEIPKKQKTLKNAVQGDIVVFGGIVENSDDARKYEAKILFRIE